MHDSNLRCSFAPWPWHIYRHDRVINNHWQSGMNTSRNRTRILVRWLLIVAFCSRQGKSRGTFIVLKRSGKLEACCFRVKLYPWTNTEWHVTSLFRDKTGHKSSSPTIIDFDKWLRCKRKITESSRGPWMINQSSRSKSSIWMMFCLVWGGGFSSAWTQPTLQNPSPPWV